jgi:hypothetical protein
MRIIPQWGVLVYGPAPRAGSSHGVLDRLRVEITQDHFVVIRPNRSSATPDSREVRFGAPNPVSGDSA